MFYILFLLISKFRHVWPSIVAITVISDVFIGMIHLSYNSRMTILVIFMMVTVFTIYNIYTRTNNIRL